MLGKQILILFVILIFLPEIVGTLFAPVTKKGNQVLFYWVSGQMMLWAMFELLCVPMILWRRSFSEVYTLYKIGVIFLFLLSLLRLGLQRLLGGKRREKEARKADAIQEKRSFSLAWLLVVGLLVLQLFLAMYLSYEEGDDAYYVAISSMSMDANQMYTKLPYTGGATQLDARHALAPFPIWVSVLAKASGMAPVSVAHVGLPLFLIPMAYAMFYLLGERLLEEKRRYLPYFLILSELLVLFGGYSVYSVENFLLVRSAQGKAVLGNMIIPFLFLLSFILLDHLQEQKKLALSFWVLLAVLMCAGCLCSTLGTFLLCMLTGIVGVCGVICYKRWRFLLPLFGDMLIPVGFAFLYFWLA